MCKVVSVKITVFSFLLFLADHLEPADLRPSECILGVTTRPVVREGLPDVATCPPNTHTTPEVTASSSNTPWRLSLLRLLPSENPHGCKHKGENVIRASASQIPFRPVQTGMTASEECANRQNASNLQLDTFFVTASSQYILYELLSSYKCKLFFLKAANTTLTTLQANMLHPWKTPSPPNMLTAQSHSRKYVCDKCNF